MTRHEIQVMCVNDSELLCVAFMLYFNFPNAARFRDSTSMLPLYDGGKRSNFEYISLLVPLWHICVNAILVIYQTFLALLNVSFSIYRPHMSKSRVISRAKPSIGFCEAVVDFVT